MLSFLPPPVLGVLSGLLLIFNLVFWMIPFMVVAIAKIIPMKAWQNRCMRWLESIATMWIDGNSTVAKLHKIDWRISGADNLDHDRWYLVVANHQSWVDIFVLQTVLNRRVPFLKFFIKRQLIWVPLLGFAWWALDMPFMRRHSAEAIRANPDLRRQDLEATRKLCRSVLLSPTSIMNFAEGTRFTSQKREKSGSQYQHLLRPKTGGLGLVLATMGEKLNSLLDVTIIYSEPEVSFWKLLSGRLPRIDVQVSERPIPEALLNKDPNDAVYRSQLREWIDDLWSDKDELITKGIGTA